MKTNNSLYQDQNQIEKLKRSNGLFKPSKPTVQYYENQISFIYLFNSSKNVSNNIFLNLFPIINIPTIPII